MLRAILDQGMGDCTLPCRSIELLTDEDKFCQRALLSGPVLPVDPNDTIITRFRAQAALHPDRRALSGKGPSYTFRELDEASDRVARNLIAAGVQPQSYVAFLLPRTTAPVSYTHLDVYKRQLLWQRRKLSLAISSSSAFMPRGVDVYKRQAIG